MKPYFSDYPEMKVTVGSKVVGHIGYKKISLTELEKICRQIRINITRNRAEQREADTPLVKKVHQGRISPNTGLEAVCGVGAPSASVYIKQGKEQVTCQRCKRAEAQR